MWMWNTFRFVIMKLSKKKGQTSMIDMLIASFLFIGLVTLIMVTWTNYNNRLNERLVYDQIQIKAFQVSDLLVKSPGSPTNWEENISSLKVIGLADTDRILSRNKINAFANNLTNETIKKTLNLEDYNFYFLLNDTTFGIPPVKIYETGSKPNSTSTIAVNIRRYVILETGIFGMVREVQFILWQ